MLPVVPLSPRPLPHVCYLQRAPEGEGLSTCSSTDMNQIHSLAVTLGLVFLLYRWWLLVWSSASPSLWWSSTSSSCLVHSTGRCPLCPLCLCRSPCRGQTTGGATEHVHCHALLSHHGTGRTCCDTEASPPWTSHPVRGGRLPEDQEAMMTQSVVTLQ